MKDESSLFHLNKSNKNLWVLLLYLLASVNIIIRNPWGFIDELVIILLFFGGIKKVCKNKEFVFIICILSFFLIYSLMFGKNIWKAVLFDFFVFLKPFIAFFVPYTLSIQLTSQQKNKIKYIFFFLGIYCAFQLPFLNQIYPNTAEYYSVCIFCAISYLLFSDFKKKNWCYALLILSMGLVSNRAKFFTEYIFIIFVVLFLKHKIKVNIKWFLLMSILILLAIYISWEKFEIYFISGYKNEVARSIFYYLSPTLLMDFFPFGSGFGSFATEAAARYYSPLYSVYKIDYIWGLRAIDYNTDADFLKDTFYPTLSQFGFLGFIFYAWFWIRRWRNASWISFNKYKIFIIVFFIVLIQNIADNSFTGPTGVPYMMILAFTLSRCKHTNIYS